MEIFRKSIDGICKKYMRNIHKYSSYKQINEQKQRTQRCRLRRRPQWRGHLRRPSHWVCVLCFCSFACIMNTYGYPSYIPYICHIYFPILSIYFPLCVSSLMESSVSPDMIEVRVLIKFRTFRIQN